MIERPVWYPLAQTIYRGFIPWAGRHWLERSLMKNLPQALRSPLSYLLTKKINPEDQLIAGQIETIRQNVLSQHQHQEAHLLSSDGTLPFEWIVNIASVPQYWGLFLYLCASAYQAKTILELGGCLGISGCYLASAKSCKRFVTIEASAELASIAERNLLQVARNFQVFNASFDDVLPQLLPTFEEGLDLAFIDGHHQGDATIHYFEQIRPYLHPGSLIIFDDIRWNRDMWQAWQKICQRPGMGFAIDLGRFGLCTDFSENPLPPEKHNFFLVSLFGDTWRKRRPPQTIHS